MAPHIILVESKKVITKQELFDLAAKGIINPQTPINVNGVSSTAGKAKGIVFGQSPALSTGKPADDLMPQTKQTIEVILNGAKRMVTKKELLDLAAKGEIIPETPININGTVATAKKVKGIVFGQPQAGVAVVTPTVTEEVYGVVSSAPVAPSPTPPTPVTQPVSIGQAWEQGLRNEAVRQQQGAVQVPPYAGVQVPIPMPGYGYNAAPKPQFIPAVIVGAVVAGACAILW